MVSLGCKTLRDGITTAIVFSVAGFLLLLTAAYIIPDIGYLPHITGVSGILLLLLVPVILAATIIKTRNHDQESKSVDS